MSTLSYLYAELALKKEQIIKLRTAEGELDGVQTEFVHHQRLVHEPQLTAHTWMGQLADEFSDLREDIERAYQDLSLTQLNSVLEAIDQKIRTLQAEIGSLENRITAEKARLERERLAELNNRR
ncbi:MAG: DUF5082 family protein [Bacillus sp. (in: firmicutes)]